MEPTYPSFVGRGTPATVSQASALFAASKRETVMVLAQRPGADSSVSSVVGASRGARPS